MIGRVAVGLLARRGALAAVCALAASPGSSRHELDGAGFVSLIDATSES
jgi:hypothetical protein